MTDTIPFIAIASGALLGACSVAMMETERFHILFERPIVGMVAATAMMCVVAGVVWALSQAEPSRAIYTVLGVIAAAIVTRICVFASRRARSRGPPNDICEIESKPLTNRLIAFECRRLDVEESAIALTSLVEGTVSAAGVVTFFVIVVPSVERMEHMIDSRSTINTPESQGV